MGLNQVQLNIHPADDGHTHAGSGSTGGEDRLNAGDWTFNEIVNLSGTSASHSWTIHIPDSVGGYWHVEVSVLDEVGYTATPYVASVHVTNANIPVVSATTTPAVDSGGTVHLGAGESLEVNGNAMDTDGLAQLFIHLDNSAGTVLQQIDIPIFGGGSNISFGPATFGGAPIGNYRVVIEARDSLGYWGIWDARVKVQ
jgi:hypothetical protein